LSFNWLLVALLVAFFWVPINNRLGFSGFKYLEPTPNRGKTAGIGWEDEKY
jgi:hypothetical protein